MTRRWMKEKKREHYYLKAKSENYRSRAAYKLLQIQEKFQVLSEGDVCVDLGSAPGGWLQVEKSLVGSHGRVVGIDLSTVRKVEGVEVLKGDATSPEGIEALLELCGGRANAVLSDMSPDISGHYSLDHARSVDLVRSAFRAAESLLAGGGNFVAKLFDGEMTRELLDDMRPSFQSVRVSKPVASRKQSSEMYVICKGFRKA